MGGFLGRWPNRPVGQALGWNGPPVALEDFRRCLEHFCIAWKPPFSHEPARPHASRRTGMREASSRIAITMLKVRTAIADVSTGRSALPNKVQTTVAGIPTTRTMRVWMTIFQGKAAIAA